MAGDSIKFTPLHIRRGQRIVGSICILHILLALLVLGLLLLFGRQDQLPRWTFKFLATCCSAYGLWTGSRWMQGLYVFGLSATAIFLVWLGFSVGGLKGTIVMLMGMAFAAPAISLVASTSVRAYFGMRRGTLSAEETIAYEVSQLSREIEKATRHEDEPAKPGDGEDVGSPTSFGEALSVACRSCKEMNPEGVAYCNACGCFL